MQEEFEDTKGIIRIHKSKDRQYNSQNKKDRQYNSQNKKDNWTNNDLQSTTQKTRDRATRTLLKSVLNSAAEG